MTDSVLVLDAMGVIYSSSDDVAELLIPFVVKTGGIRDPGEISRQYTLASLGELDAETSGGTLGFPSRWKTTT